MERSRINPETVGGRLEGAFSLPTVEGQIPDAIAHSERYKIIGQGLMTSRIDGSPSMLPITPANQGFFLKNKEGIDELDYQGSFEVVCALLGQYELEQGRPRIDGARAGRRPLAFFDTEGEFYDQMLLHEIVELLDEGLKPTGKHAAVFEKLDYSEKIEKVTTKIDDIICISTAVVEGEVPQLQIGALIAKKIELKAKSKK